VKIAHLTTVDISLRFLLMPQLLAIRDAGHEAIGISAPGPWVSELEAAGIRHIALQSSTRGIDPMADLRAACELRRIIRHEQFDVLHTHNPKPGLYGRIVGRACGVPLVVNTVHGLYATADDPWPKRVVVYGLEALAARFSNVELVQGAEEFETLTRWRITPPNRTRLLGNGIDLLRFEPATESTRISARRMLGIPSDAIVVGMVGRLVAEKGWLEFFEASRHLQGNVQVLAIGDADTEKSDALSPEIMDRARESGVIFAGFRQDIEALYAAMDVFVLPSHREGFPRTAMEAAACGLPIVASDIRGCREVVVDGVDGLLVPPRHPAALGVAIQSLVDDRERRVTMGLAGRKKAELEFDETVIVDRVLAAYDSSRGRPRRHRHAARSRSKRMFDVLVASAALLILAPVLAAIWLAVRILEGRPVLFAQPRPGFGGKIIVVHKFRTMNDARDELGHPLPDGKRLTSLGRWLRATSLDELPQLVDVVRGDLSLVGPRPLLIHYVERYSTEQMRRHEVVPGITGWAQVNGRNALDWPQRLSLDVWYVDHWSFLLDLRILGCTVQRVLSGQGISAPGEDTMAEFMAEVDQGRVV
jgi:lipopolysaccharide/colanic/teichoic acid biosynthesis glycosyltransferase/glycosyltransferase involved in cell wall biosynthesis